METASAADFVCSLLVARDVTTAVYEVGVTCFVLEVCSGISGNPLVYIRTFTAAVVIDVNNVCPLSLALSEDALSFRRLVVLYSSSSPNASIVQASSLRVLSLTQQKANWNRHELYDDFYFVLCFMYGERSHSGVHTRSIIERSKSLFFCRVRSKGREGSAEGSHGNDCGARVILPECTKDKPKALSSRSPRSGGVCHVTNTPQKTR